MVLNNFKQVLQNEGVEKIEATIGGEFNHNLHHAIEEEESDKVEAGKILAIKQEGYTLKGRLLRPTSVVIAKDKNNKEEKKEN
jgi:molecular chaperone GrpE